LAEEQKRQQELAADRIRFEAEQQRKEQERVAAQKAEEARLAALKAELARKKRTVPAAAAGSLAAAVAEIKRLNAEIGSIETTFAQELTAGKERITARYDKEIAAVRQAAKQAQQQQELDALEKRLDAAQQEQTKELRQSSQQLATKQFSIGQEYLTAELGVYDADKQHFPVSITSKIPEIKLAMNATIPLPHDAARKFKQDWQDGMVQPLSDVTAGGEVRRVALTNDGDGMVRECQMGNCMSEQERMDHFVYTDLHTGLQWTRNANIAGKRMPLEEAVRYLNKINIAGCSGWRLPTKDELEAFVKQGGKKPFKMV